MKKTASLKIAGAVLASVLSTLAIRADLAINENVSLFGYAAGSITYNKVQQKSTDTTMDIDAAKLGVTLDFSPITATISGYTDAGASKIYLLDAYVSYDFGSKLKLSAGRFVTWLGYESFDLVDNTFSSFGNATISDSLFNNIIPSYQHGVRIEYVNEKAKLGLSAVDSVYNVNDEFYRGDGDVRDGFGVEGNFTYTEEQWTLGMTLAYQYTKAGYQDFGGIDPYIDEPETFTADIWLERKIGEDITIAGEIVLMREKIKGVDAKNTFYAMLMAKQQIDEKIAIAGRFSFGDRKDYGNFWKVTVSPVTYEVTKNLEIRTEMGYTRFDKELRDNGMAKYEFMAGVQAVLKF
ncbi:hypothetical protein M2447_002290 [Ereboglobus sp. PH5-10]|uniref:outer membrane beta-barrel protein n=1 Tax=Ereboglobus sp. PH5-10 TaxID=2940629 RepID=UPI0024058694|nr:outer membrane beta-barrel protein [Ereboglobus sp. PH5-10]MDF9828172.1 hypothetical protein [Ereboglobus sp. PH5-10]